MVTGNIVYLLRNFLRCSAYETVIFGWVMHQREIIDGLLEQLQDLDFRFYLFTLTLFLEGAQCPAGTRHCKWGCVLQMDRTQCRAFAPL